MSTTVQLHIRPETLETATGEAKALLAATQQNLGFIPNMYGYMAKYPALLANYMASYKAFRETGGFTPAEQEVVFYTISRLNGCQYCMAAHAMLADKVAKVAAPDLAALRAGQKLPTEKLQALAQFVRSMVESRGNPGKPAVDAFLAAGYSEQQVLAIIVAIAAKSYSNSINQLAGTPVDAAFAAYQMK